jgi:hypothetical protein
VCSATSRCTGTVSVVTSQRPFRQQTVSTRSRIRSGAHRGHATGNRTVSPSAQAAAQPARPLAPQLHPLELLLTVGLAGVFIVNAVVALLEPSDFTGLLERSLVGRVIPTMSGQWVAWVIAVHDLTIGVALLTTMWISRARPFVLAWAGDWLLAVALVKLTALKAFGG